MKFNFLSLGLILALALIPTQQIQSQEYTLSISSTSAIPGEVIEIPINIEATSKSIGSANLAISAAGALDITSVLPGSAIDTSAADFMDFDLNPVGMPVDMNGVLIGIIVDTANPLAAPGPNELAKLQISVSAFAKPTLVGEISFSDTLSGSLGASPNLVVEGSLPFGEFSGTDLMYQSGSVTVNTPPVTNLLVDITDVCNCSASASWTNGFTYNVIEVWVDSLLAATYQDLDEDGFVDNTSPPEPMPTSFDLGTTSTQIEVIAISNNEAAAAVLATVPGCTPNPDDDNDGCPDCSSGEYDPNNDGIDTDSDGLCDSGDPDLDGDGIPNDCDVDFTNGTDCDTNGEDDTCQLDTDMDGTIDACDNCPNDFNKTEPGTCGCGVIEDDDCDDDTIPNACDIDLTGGTDCDTNGEDDTCQLDTDMDGTIDPCDDDLDGDGIPNNCDVDQTAGTDSNGNGEDDICEVAFRRGDSNSNGAINVADPYWILLYLFSTDVSELPCYDAADIDDNGSIEMIDAVSLFQMLYGTGGVPADPFATCGVDPTTADALDCVTPSNACQ
ncbi:MAG: cohesin domain-containing protein [Planctomycetota bacterium]